MMKGEARSGHWMTRRKTEIRCRKRWPEPLRRSRCLPRAPAFDDGVRMSQQAPPARVVQPRPSQVQGKRAGCRQARRVG